MLVDCVVLEKEKITVAIGSLNVYAVQLGFGISVFQYIQGDQLNMALFFWTF